MDRLPFAAAVVVLALPILSPPRALGEEPIVWAFDSPAGYEYDAARVEIVGGEAILRRDAAWPDPERPCLRPITVAAPGGSVGLTQIRLLLDQTNFDFTKAAPDGHDLRFVDGLGAVLGHWVESFDPSAPKALVTVALPAFPAPENRTIQLFYGDSTCAPDGSWESAFLDGMQDLPVASITSGQRFDAFPAMERMANGDLLAVYRTGSGHSSSDGALMLARSSDDGETWTTSPLYDNPARDDRVDIGLKRLSNGTLLLPFFQSFGGPVGCFLLKSIDGGNTWSGPYQVPNALDRWMAFYGQIVELPDGTLLLPAYGESRTDEHTRALVLQSTNGGTSWSLRASIVAPGISLTELSILPLDGMELLGIVRDSEWEPQLYQTRSHDAGWSWDPPEPLFLGASPSLYRLSNGHILLGTSDRAGITGVRISVSTDDGASWPAAVLVDPDFDTDIGYPVFAERSDGSVVMVSYKRYAGLRRATFGEPFVAENPNAQNFFDGLEDGSTGNWEIWRLSGYPTMTGLASPGRASDHALFLYDTSGSQSVSSIRTLYDFEQPSGAISFWIRPDAVANGIEFRLMSGSDAYAASTRFRFRVSSDATLDFLCDEGATGPQWHPLTPAGALPLGAWTKVEIGFRCADDEAGVSVAGSFVGTAHASAPGGDITHLGFYAGLSPGTGARFLVDDLYASRYVAPGPVPAVGVETTAFAPDGPAVATFTQEPAGPGAATAFREAAVKNGGEILYQLSNDGGEIWRWWDGETWAPASDDTAKANTAAELGEWIGLFPAAGRISVRAFLMSNGTHAVGLDHVEIDFASSVAAPEGAPLAFSASPPSPNPAFDSAAFALSLPRSAALRVGIFDVAGRRVREILTPVLPPGRHRIAWDCRRDDGERAAAGVYFYAVDAGADRAHGRLAVVR